MNKFIEHEQDVKKSGIGMQSMAKKSPENQAADYLSLLLTFYTVPIFKYTANCDYYE